MKKITTSLCLLILILSSCKKENIKQSRVDAGIGEVSTGPVPTTCYYPLVAVSILTGSGNPITRDGNLKTAQVAAPNQMIRYNDIIYFSQGNDVRKIQSSYVSTIYTGTSSGSNINALTTDPDGNLFISTNNFEIKKISPVGSVLASYGTSGVSGYSLIAPFRFRTITGLATDLDGRLYIQDDGNKVILRLNTDGTLEKMAGQPGLSGWIDGPVSTARIDRYQAGITVSPSGDKIYFVDDAKLRVISDGAVSTIAGNIVRGYTNGNSLAARFGRILGMTMDVAGNFYVSEISVTPSGSYDGYKIRKIIKMTSGLIPWTVSTLAGDGVGSSGGGFTIAAFNHPTGLAVSSDLKNIYVADYYGHNIKRLALTWFACILNFQTNYYQEPIMQTLFTERRLA